MIGKTFKDFNFSIEKDFYEIEKNFINEKALEEHTLREYMIYLHKTKLSLIKQILNKDNEIENIRRKILRVNESDDYSIQEKNKMITDMIMNLSNFKQNKKENLTTNNNTQRNKILKNQFNQRTINWEDSFDQNQIKQDLDPSLSQKEGSLRFLPEKNKKRKESLDIDKFIFKENFTYTDNYENSRITFINLDNSYNWSNRSLLSSNKNSNLNSNNIFYKKSLHSHLNKPTGNKLVDFRSPSKTENSQFSQSEKILNTNNSDLSSSSSRSPRRIELGFFNVKNRINLNLNLNSSSSKSIKSNTDSNSESSYKQSNNINNNNHVDFILGSKTKRKYRSNGLKSFEKKNSGLTQTNIKDIFEKLKK